MVPFLAAAAGLWALGHAMRAPGSARWLMIGLLYVAVLAVHVVLPEGHPLREALGGSGAEWVALGILGMAAWGYSRLLKQVRARVRPENRAPEAGETAPAPRAGAFSEGEITRYARHVTLREIGGPGQKKLKHAKVLVVGAGGLGAPVLQYLAGAGVGTIGVIDGDEVEATNLQRQVIHSEAWVGKPKVFSAQAAINSLNPFVNVRPYHRRLEEDIADALLADYDMVVDGTDDFPTRYLVNRAAAARGLPLVAGALSQWEGQLSVYDPSSGTPCYQCIFPQPPAPGLAPSCAEAGVLGPLPGVVGAMMAVEAVKEIVQAGATLKGRMLIYDALYGETRTITLKRRPDCSVCGGT